MLKKTALTQKTSLPNSVFISLLLICELHRLTHTNPPPADEYRLQWLQRTGRAATMSLSARQPPTAPQPAAPPPLPPILPLLRQLPTVAAPTHHQAPRPQPPLPPATQGPAPDVDSDEDRPAAPTTHDGDDSEGTDVDSYLPDDPEVIVESDSESSSSAGSDGSESEDGNDPAAQGALPVAGPAAAPLPQPPLPVPPVVQPLPPLPQSLLDLYRWARFFLSPCIL